MSGLQTLILAGFEPPNIRQSTEDNDFGGKKLGRIKPDENYA
jgi:hypothetical protein